MTAHILPSGDRRRAYERNTMHTRTLGAATLVLALALGGVLATAVPASATNPGATVSTVCNTETGLVDVTSTVTGDPGYPNVKGVIKSAKLNGADFASLLEQPVKGSNGVTKSTSVAFTTGYTLKVGVQFENHGAGDLVYREVKHTPGFRSCKPADKLDAEASATVTPATCESPSVASFAIKNATWDDETDTTDGSRNATAIDGHKFANDSKTATVTYTVEAQLDPNKAPCLPGQPEPKVEVVVTKDAIDCTTGIRPIKTSTITTRYDVWNPETRKWDPSAPTQVDTYEFVAVDDETFFEECAPEAPEPESTTTVVRAYECGDTDVTVTTTTTGNRWDWDLVARKYVETILEPVVVVTHDEPNATDKGERGACDSLAITGVEPTVPLSIAGGLLMAGLGMLVIPGVRRRIFS